jgi:hypothetical protein
LGGASLSPSMGESRREGAVLPSPWQGPRQTGAQAAVRVWVVIRPLSHRERARVRANPTTSDPCHPEIVGALAHTTKAPVRPLSLAGTPAGRGASGCQGVGRHSSPLPPGEGQGEGTPPRNVIPRPRRTGGLGIHCLPQRAIDCHSERSEESRRPEPRGPRQRLSAGEGPGAVPPSPPRWWTAGKRVPPFPLPGRDPGGSRLAGTARVWVVIRPLSHRERARVRANRTTSNPCHPEPQRRIPSSPAPRMPCACGSGPGASALLR